MISRTERSLNYLILSLFALRMIKGVLITLQYRNKAAEGRLDRPE